MRNKLDFIKDCHLKKINEIDYHIIYFKEFVVVSSLKFNPFEITLVGGETKVLSKSNVILISLLLKKLLTFKLIATSKF